jgi:hypothetical protein
VIKANDRVAVDGLSHGTKPGATTNPPTSQPLSDSSTVLTSTHRSHRQNRWVVIHICMGMPTDRKVRPRGYGGAYTPPQRAVVSGGSPGQQLIEADGQLGDLDRPSPEAHDSPPAWELGCGHIDLHVVAISTGNRWDQKNVTSGVHRETANTVSGWPALTWLNGPNLCHARVNGLNIRGVGRYPAGVHVWVFT